MAWWEEMFELPAWQGVQLGWESVEDAEQQVDRDRARAAAGAG